MGGQVSGRRSQKIVYANPHFRQKADGKRANPQVWNESYNKPRVSFTGYGQDPRENQTYKSQHLQNIKKVSDLYPGQTPQKNASLNKSAITKLKNQEIYGRLRQDMHNQKSSLMQTRNYLPADMIRSEDQNFRSRKPLTANQSEKTFDKRYVLKKTPSATLGLQKTFSGLQKSTQANRTPAQRPGITGKRTTYVSRPILKNSSTTLNLNQSEAAKFSSTGKTYPTTTHQSAPYPGYPKNLLGANPQKHNLGANSTFQSTKPSSKKFIRIDSNISFNTQSHLTTQKSKPPPI